MHIEKKFTAKSYVQDGLVAMWDGEWNAGPGKHDPNATVWKDLTGNHYDFTLNARTYTWEDDAITGVASPVSPYYIGQVETAPGGIDAVYMESVCVIPNTWQIMAVLGKNPSSNVRRGECIIGPGFFDSSYIGSTYGIPVEMLGRKVSVSVAYARSGLYVKATKLLVNGELCDNIISANAQDTGNNNYFPYPRIGGRGQSSPAMKDNAKLCNIRLYSRALTAAEIAANYAVDKARFNLPDAT